MTHRSKSALAAPFLLLLLAAGPGIAFGSGPPDTPQGRRMAALVGAFETGTPEATRAFIAANFAAAALKDMPLEQRAERLSAIAKETGALEFDPVVRGEGREVAFLAREKHSGQWVQVGMMLETGPPFGIRSLRFDDSDAPGAARSKPAASDAEAAAATAADLRRLADADEFSGVVLLAKDGKPFFRYSNAGYVVLSLIVEKLSGQS